jgi:hypothetical protein
LLSLPELAKEPESSDHVDDETLALLTAGAASAGELTAVRGHLVVCPACRRLVGRALSDADRSEPEVRQAPVWGWLRRWPTLLASAAAASVLLGLTLVTWSWNRGGAVPRPAPQPGPGNALLLAELLPAPVSWQRSSLRGNEPERSTITFKIDSPRDGIAVVLMVANGHWELLRGERPTKQGPGNDYGPIESPSSPVVYIVVLCDRLERGELSGTIRDLLPSEARDIEAHDANWRSDVRARLTRGGHRWVSIESIRVSPTEPGPGDSRAPAPQPTTP